MKRVALVAAVALAATGTAGAATFAVAPSTVVATPALPSAEAPNAPGSIAVPSPLSSAPAAPQRLAYAELETLWQRAGAAYGIPWQVLAAINKIESDFGRNMGPSSAGAVGWMQFMPETWSRWGLDATGDGVADPWRAEDAIYAAARYLAAAGGRTDLERAVYAYNHAQWYVDEVMELASVFGDTAPATPFAATPGFDVAVAAGERAVADAARALAAAQADTRRLAHARLPYLRRAASAPLLSDRLAARKLAVEADLRHQQALLRVARLRAALAAAEGELGAARQSAAAAAFAPEAAPVVAPATMSGDYAFPVGGGATVVSVSHHHHDYPAADIAAPAGAPVYALADAVVEHAWHGGDARCGIGLTLRTADDRSWTYCHLSYLDPRVDDGAFVTAGSEIGLVGSTGHSTGPHLHLQLRPATSYPQDEEWFRAFADTAFSWQDGDPGRVPQTAPRAVFAVAPPGDAAEGSVVAFTR